MQLSSLALMNVELAASASRISDLYVSTRSSTGSARGVHAEPEAKVRARLLYDSSRSRLPPSDLIVIVED